MLKRSGFDTIVGIDLDKAGMDDAARARHGRVATPPTVMRTSRTVSSSICKATAAEARVSA